MSEMTFEQAQDVMASIVANRVRWGKMYDGSDLGLSKLMDALVCLAQNDGHEVAEVRKGLATANRQIGAGKAREAKLKKQVETLKHEIDNLTGLNDILSERVQKLVDGAAAGSPEDGEREDQREGAEGSD